MYHTLESNLKHGERKECRFYLDADKTSLPSLISILPIDGHTILDSEMYIPQPEEIK